MTSNTASNRSRNLLVLRVGAVAGLLAIIGFSSLLIAQSQAQNATATSVDSAVTVAETATVSTGTLTTTLDTAGNLAPIQATTLTFPASAPITAVYIEPGSAVVAGQVLATLDTTDGEARVRQSQLSLAQQELSLNELLSEPTDLELESAQLQIEAAQASLYSSSSSSQVSATDVEIARLQTELAANSLWQAQMSRDERIEQAAARSATGEADYGTQLSLNSSVNSAESNLELSQLEYEDTVSGGSSDNYSQIVSGQNSLANAEDSLAELLAGATSSQRRLAEISVEQAQMDLTSAQNDLKNYALVAPFDGIVADETLIVGMLPASGSVTLIDTSTFTMDVSIAESDVSSVSVGQPATVVVQALPEAELTGVLTRLAAMPVTSGNGVVTYTATITLDPAPDVALRPGMSAVASIILEQHVDVVLVPNRFLTTDAATGATTVMVETAPGVYTQTAVTLGARGASESEVTSGLDAGDTIVLLVTESDATTTQTGGGLGLGSLLGGGGGGGQAPSGNFSPPSGGGGGAPPSGGGGAMGGG